MCLKILEERLEELSNFKTKVQEFMSQKDESIEHIQEWQNEHEDEVQEKNKPIEELKK